MAKSHLRQTEKEIMLKIGTLELEITSEDQQEGTRLANRIVETGGATSFGIAQTICTMLSAMARHIKTLEEKGQIK